MSNQEVPDQKVTPEQMNLLVGLPTGDEEKLLANSTATSGYVLTDVVQFPVKPREVVEPAETESARIIQSVLIPPKAYGVARDNVRASATEMRRKANLESIRGVDLGHALQDPQFDFDPTAKVPAADAQKAGKAVLKIVK